MFDKPIYLGSTVLELWKLFIYETQFDTMQPFFDPKLKRNLQLQCMGTESFVLNIKTNDLFNGLIKLQEEKGLFDFIRIANDNPLFCNENMNVTGKFKIETPDTMYIDNFCALRSKGKTSMKPYEIEKKKPECSIKIVMKTIKIDEYKQCLKLKRSTGKKFWQKCW